MNRIGNNAPCLSRDCFGLVLPTAAALVSVANTSGGSGDKVIVIVIVIVVVVVVVGAPGSGSSCSCSILFTDAKNKITM
jgi:hypothetical protein